MCCVSVLFKQIEIYPLLKINVCQPSTAQDILKLLVYFGIAYSSNYSTMLFPAGIKNCLLTRYYVVKDLCIQLLVRKLLLCVLYNMVSQPVDINTNTYWFNCQDGLLLNTLFMMTLDVLYWAFFMFDYYNSNKNL